MNIYGELNSNNTDIADRFNDFYSTLAENLVGQLPTAPNKYGKNETTNYYEGKNLKNDNFIFKVVDQLKIYKILENINDSKSPGFDNIPGRFLKDGGKIISKYIADIFNLSITLSKFFKLL